ncbi:MAG TPA: hypothetical protein VH593_15995 [Ktedonobacteraceae bacterium]|jgi:hypothetical protein
MAISLLTAKRKNVEPFRWDDLPDRFSYLINELLKLQVFLQGKVTGGLFAVLAWSAVAGYKLILNIFEAEPPSIGGLLWTRPKRI